jgi:23S rRNA (adenine2503-C2)-methyltransferase
MRVENLEKFFISYPKYRLEQAKRAVFVDLVENWNKALALPEELREVLNKKYPLEINAEVFKSGDEKTLKALIQLKDRKKIETVLMGYKSGRNTACVSSQAGCALNCSFCATGKMGFKRNLSASEIVEQVLFWARWLKNNQRTFWKSQDKITNVVFMGMGEPLLNYGSVMEAIRILNDQQGFGLGARHFSISTSGVVEGIEKIAEEPLQVNLAISLHAPNDDLRSKLMPINKKYSIPEILAAVDGYIRKTGRKVMFEYIMIDGINDSAEYALELAKIMKKHLYFINLIPCNKVGNFQPSSQEKIEKFKNILKSKGVQVNQRYSFGQDIQAACGQLAGKCA